MSHKMLAASLSLALGALASLPAEAIHLSTDGRGQVLIYPYYTVNGGNATLISVVNTTEEVKALRVRFREAMNGQEVWQFNLYLGPLDVWTGALTGASEALDPIHAAAAALQTSDRSCTVPQMPAEGQAFNNFEYAFNNDDGGPYEDSRTRAGYIEIIEMGRLTGEFAAAVTRTEAGLPANCQRLVDAWHPGTQGQANGVWVDHPDDGLLPPNGGLYGGAEIVDVANGTNLSYSAEAIDGFYMLSSGSLHDSPESWEQLNLGSARMSDDGTVSAYVIDDGELIRLDFDESMSDAPGLKAISAVLMREWVYNEFDSNPGFTTEWVLTFPTRGLHLRYPTRPDIGDDDREPFYVPYDYDIEIGEPYTYQAVDREAQVFIPVSNPLRPPQPGSRIVLSVTVLSLNPEDAYRSVWRYGNPPTVLLGAYDTFPVFSLGLVGTAQLGFERSRYQLQDRNGHIIYGLPVLGFSAIRATLEGGSGSALANFSVTHRHHMKTTVETADTP
jgi:hypothetical protein